MLSYRMTYLFKSYNIVERGGGLYNVKENSPLFTSQPWKIIK